MAEDLNWPRGRTITAARPITPEELEAEGWEGNRWGMNCTVLVLDDGSLLYASQDPEGNGPGAMFGKLAAGGHVSI